MNDYVIQEMAVGHKESFTVTISEEMLQTFSKLSGDYNPLHMDSDFAKAHQFKDKVVYGMLVASFYSTLVGMWLPGKEALLQEVSTLFRNPVYVGDVLTINGTVKEVDMKFNRIKISAEIRNQEGKKVSSATIYSGFSNTMRRA